MRTADTGPRLPCPNRRDGGSRRCIEVCVLNEPGRSGSVAGDRVRWRSPTRRATVVAMFPAMVMFVHRRHEHELETVRGQVVDRGPRDTGVFRVSEVRGGPPMPAGWATAWDL